MPKPDMTIDIASEEAEKMPAIICDLDGTLADIGDRNPYDASECGYDKLNHIIYRLLRKYHKDGYKILIITGRPSKYYDETNEWLTKMFVPVDAIIMRAPGDTQPDFSLKHRMYNQHIKDKYEVEFVLEDRNRVVRMWRQIGLTCLQVSEGDF